MKSSHPAHPLTWDALARRYWVDVDTVLLEGEVCAVKWYSVAWTHWVLLLALSPGHSQVFNVLYMYMYM